MKCKEIKAQHKGLVTSAFKLVKRNEWLDKKIQEKAQTEQFDLAQKLSLESVDTTNKLREVRVEISALENTFGFLRVKE